MFSLSPSSRRAWIEIAKARFTVAGSCVALLAEGVDRNYEDLRDKRNIQTSPSSRRAWIEIRHDFRGMNGTDVSPSSRRAWIEIFLP